MALAIANPEDALERELSEIGRRARAAEHALAHVSAATRTAALTEAATRIRAARAAILAANRRDLADNLGLTAAFTDRLMLDDKRIDAMAAGIDTVAALPDPIGEVTERWTRPNGLVIERVRVPLGVIGIIYESRPNVTADAAALCLRSGNAVILRGGSESFHSSAAILAAFRDGIAAAGVTPDAVQAVPTRDRAAVGKLLTMSDAIDVIVPRGGKSLIARVQAESRMPVIAHLEGNCHVYVHASAKPETARAVTLNAKMRRTGVCGAAESLLIDRAAAKPLLPALLDDLIRAGCAVRGDAETRALDARVTPASEADWSTEYLDAIIAVRVVDGLDQAIEHVNRYGSHHTDAIIAEDDSAARRFLDEVDSAIVLHNASTQFADGGEFGFGAEIGISTGKLHARGPVGAAQLTSYKYRVHGTGQVRP
ncbi:MAG TPA: glutamate-5-semialdehyde dehydrogenase [Candidatus Sulfotelmatobacter sp.]|nr:glutamate-5-semialdehyde dehydrogenase [Candidatus Sulfotelmatobacter sp.]